MFDLKKLLDDTGKNVGRFFSPQQKKPQPVQRQGFVPGQPQQSFQNLHSQQPQQPTAQAPFMLNRSNYQTPKAEPAQIPPPSVNKPQKNTLGYLPTGIENIANGIGGAIKYKLKDTLLDPGSKTSIVQKAINTTPAVGLGQLPTAQGIARGFDQVTRSIGEAGANSLAGLSGLPQTADLSDKKNPTILGIPHTEGVASILYGQDPVKSIQRETDDLQQSARRSANPTIRAVAPYAPFAAPVIAGVDAGGLVGLGGGAGAIAKEAPQALRTTTKIVNQTANDYRALPQSIREGGYAKIPDKLLSDVPASRPADDIQKAIENAHNAGDSATASRLISQLPQDYQASTRSALGIEPLPTTKLVPSVQDKVLTSKPAQYLFGDKQPVIDAKSNAENITIPGQPEPKLVNNRFTQRIQNSPEVSPEVQAQVSGEHVVRNTKGLVGSVQHQIKSEGLHPATSRTMAELAQSDASDETLARAIELAKQHDASGTKAGQDVAASLYDQVSEHGVRKGQGIQILSQIAKGSPAGLRNKAFRDLKKAGVEVTPEMKAEIQGHIDTIKSLPDGHAKDFAIAVMQKAVQKHMPQGLTDNLVSLWKAGLLSGVKTQEGNAISNSLFGGLKKVADIPATATDKAISLLTKQRTKALTLRGSAQGAKEGAKSGLTTMKTGIDFRNMGDKYEQHAEINLKNKALQNLFGKPANFVFRGMSAADQPFYYSALKNSLYDQAKAEGITKGLRGKSLKDYMNQTVKNPGEAMVDRADQEAAKSVLGYDTFASKAVTGIHKGIDGIKGVSEQGKAIAHGVVNVLAPFTRVPSAFLSRTIDFTPFGVGKEIFSQVWKKKFDQRALSQAIGEGLTGTGAIAIGMGLANSGQLSGDYPKNDPKEQARWKAEGITANSVKLGNRWYSLNYMGPLGLLFGAGNNLVKAQKGDATAADQAGAVLGGLGSGLLNQSFVQGLSGFSNAIQDPQRNLQSFVNSQAGSVIPSIVNDIGNATDNMQRQANSPIDAMKARIPFVRQGLNPKQDSFGNDLRQAPGNGVEVAFNGTKPSKDTNTPVTREVNRLKDTGKENFVIPTTDKTINVGGETVKLNGNQQYAWNKLVGNKIQDTWGQLIKSPDYQALSDDDKANALRKSMTDITATSKVDFLNKIGRSQLANTASDKLTNAQAEGIDLGNYTSPKSAMGSTRTVNNKTAYNDALRKYQKNSGKLSDIQKIKAQDNLASLKIKSGFDKSVTDLYGMSKSDAYAYLSADPDGKAKAQKLIDYGDAQVQAGTTKTNKFKTKDGSVSIQPKDYNPSSAPVERWRAAVSKYFPKEEVNKALWVVAHESGGNETASGDGGKAVGLFQDQHIAPGTSPEDQIKDAARLYTENKKNGGSGWADWGENNLYQGKKFGALGNNPYPGDKKAIEILATMRGGSSGTSGTSAVASSSTSKSSGKKKGVKAYNLFANIKSTGGTEQSLRNILKKYGGSANVKTARKIKH